MLNWLKSVLRQSDPPSLPPSSTASATTPLHVAPSLIEVERTPAPKSSAPPAARQQSRPRKTPLDDDGQPKEARFNRARRSDRSTSELIGMAKAIMLDRVVTPPEVSLLVDWFEANPDAALSYPGNVLARRLERILEDDVVDAEELEDLSQLLGEITGLSHGEIIGANAATTLPLDRPQPELRFSGTLWVFTGKMAYGPRSLCEQEIRGRGGECATTITQKTSYLVIGTIGSRDWIHTTHGRKIEQAVDFRGRGVPIAIIGEDHWTTALDRAR